MTAHELLAALDHLDGDTIDQAIDILRARIELLEHIKASQTGETATTIDPLPTTSEVTRKPRQPRPHKSSDEPIRKRIGRPPKVRFPAAEIGPTPTAQHQPEDREPSSRVPTEIPVELKARVIEYLFTNGASRLADIRRGCGGHPAQLKPLMAEIATEAGDGLLKLKPNVKLIPR